MVRRLIAADRFQRTMLDAHEARLIRTRERVRVQCLDILSFDILRLDILLLDILRLDLCLDIATCVSVRGESAAGVCPTPRVCACLYLPALVWGSALPWRDRSCKL